MTSPATSSLPSGRQPANAAQIRLLDSIHRQVTGSDNVDNKKAVIEQALLVAQKSSYRFEQTILAGALTSQDTKVIDKVLSLCGRYGRIFYAMATPEVVAKLKIAETTSSEETEEDSSADLSAQLAWDRLEAGATTEYALAPSFYDPAGALCVGVFYAGQLVAEPVWSQVPNASFVPPFAVLFHESPERLSAINEGNFERLGEIKGVPERFKMVVVPKGYAPLLRSSTPVHFLGPVSEGLEDYCDQKWAEQLPDEAVIVTSIKGFTSSGKTPSDHLTEVIEEADKSAFVFGLFGFAPAMTWIQELGQIQKKPRDKLGRRELVLTCRGVSRKGAKINEEEMKKKAIEVARSFAGPDAETERSIFEQDGKEVETIVVRSRSTQPAVTVRIVWDPDLVRANELASIYKNNEAVDRGAQLLDLLADPKAHFRKDLYFQQPGPVCWDNYVKGQIVKKYFQFVEEGMAGIKTILGVVKVPDLKRIIFPAVLNDLTGSWAIRDDGEVLREVFELVQSILNPDSSEAEWKRALVLIRHKIRGLFAVRNPVFGFCVALDRRVALMGRYLSHAEVLQIEEELLKERIELKQENREPRQIDNAHYFYSTLPPSLRHPEGFQVAQLNPEYCRRLGIKTLAGFPESVRRVHQLTREMQSVTEFPKEIRRRIVELSKEIAIFKPETEIQAKRFFIQALRRLNRQFQAALAAYDVAAKHLRRVDQSRAALENIVSYIRGISITSRAKTGLPAETYAWLNQKILEILTRAHLFVILHVSQRGFLFPPLTASLVGMRGFLDDPKIETLFPTEEGEEPLSVAEQLTEEEKGVFLAFRNSFFRQIGGGLVDLTRAMSLKLHADEEKIDLHNIRSAVAAVIAGIGGVTTTDASITPVIERLLKPLREIQTSLGAAEGRQRFDPMERKYIYNALIEWLVHARRLMVFPDDRAPAEFDSSIRRARKILHYLKTKEGSPLWDFQCS